MRKINWKLLIICLAIPLAVMGLITLIIMGSFQKYGELNLPFFAPPGWLFAPVWIVLYVLMGISLYLVLNNKNSNREAIIYFGVQLLFNFAWPIVFFNFGLFWLAFVWIAILIYLIIRMMITFYRVNKVACWLQLPYLLWTVFATILNLAIAIMN